MRLSKALDFAPEDVSPRLAQSVQHLTYPSIQAGNVEPGPPITTAPRRIEIVGTAQLGNDGYWVGLDNSDGWVETWSRDEDAYALRLKGDSMAPAIRSGWVAVCEPNHRLVPGEYVMVTTSDGQSMVKELLRKRGWSQCDVRELGIRTPNHRLVRHRQNPLRREHIGTKQDSQQDLGRSPHHEPPSGGFYHQKIN